MSFWEKIQEIEKLNEQEHFEESKRICISILEYKLKNAEKLLVLSYLVQIESELNLQKNVEKYCNEFISCFFELAEIDIGKFKELYVSVLLKRAQVYLDTNKIQLSIYDFERIISDYQKYDIENKEFLLNAHLSLSRIQGFIAKNKNGDERQRILLLAENNALKAGVLSPADSVPHIFLGVIYNEMGEFDKAEMAYKKSIEIDIAKIRNQFKRDEIFYRYREISYNNIDVITNGKLYLSLPKSFNDPYDCIIYRNPNYRKNKIFAKVLDKVRIACFSKDNDSILMWSHYANSHKGICIGYQLTEKFLVENNVCFDEIIYKNSYEPDKNFKSVFHESFFVKNDIWEYENEYRLLSFKNKDNFIAAPKINHIIFGLNCSNKSRDIVYEALKEKEDIDYYQVVENPEDYMKMKIIKLDDGIEI